MRRDEDHAGSDASGSCEALAPQLWVQANHDLRQPLQALFFMTRSLARAGDAKVRETAAYMEAALQGLQNKLELVTELSRLEAGSKVPQLCTCALADICQSLMPKMTTLAAGHDIDLRSRLGDAKVVSDGQLLNLMVRSLMLNAIKLANRGDVLMASRKRGKRVSLEVYFKSAPIGDAQTKGAFVQLSPKDQPSSELGLGLGFIEHLGQSLDHQLERKILPNAGVRLALLLPAAA
jgi:signal transduction histidine kinase